MAKPKSKLELALERSRKKSGKPKGALEKALERKRGVKRGGE